MYCSNYVQFIYDEVHRLNYKNLIHMIKSLQTYHTTSLVYLMAISHKTITLTILNRNNHREFRVY